MPDYGASGGGMGQMIQMIAALSQMQTSKRELALREAEYKTHKDEFNTKLGLDAKDEKSKAINKLLDRISDGSVDAHVAATDLAKLQGLTPEEAQLFAHVAPSATAAQQLFSTANQRAGLESMTPEQRMVAQQNTYLANQAQSNRAGQSTGELISALAGGGNPQAAFGKDMMANLGKGYAIRAATGQDPFQFAMSMAGLQNNMAPAAQSIAAGITPSAGQMLGAQTQNTATLAGLTEAGIRAGAGSKMAPSDYSSLINQLRETTKAFTDPKNASAAAREQLKQQYNSIARTLNLGIINSDADIPGAVSLIDKLWNGIQGAQVPQVGPVPTSSMPMMPQGMSPTNQFAPFYGGTP